MLSSLPLSKNLEPGPVFNCSSVSPSQQQFSPLGSQLFDTYSLSLTLSVSIVLCLQPLTFVFSNWWSVSESGCFSLLSALSLLSSKALLIRLRPPPPPPALSPVDQQQQQQDYTGFTTTELLKWHNSIDDDDQQQKQQQGWSAVLIDQHSTLP